MKKLGTIFCIVICSLCSVTFTVPAGAQSKNHAYSQSRAARKAQKRQQKELKKYMKAQRKAQKRMQKQSRKNQYHRSMTF